MTFVAGTQPEQIPADLADHLPGVEFALMEWRDYHVTIPGANRLKVGNVWIELDKVDASRFEDRTFMRSDDDIKFVVGFSLAGSVNPLRESTPESQVHRLVT